LKKRNRQTSKKPSPGEIGNRVVDVMVAAIGVTAKTGKAAKVVVSVNRVANARIEASKASVLLGVSVRKARASVRSRVTIASHVAIVLSVRIAHVVIVNLQQKHRVRLSLLRLLAARSMLKRLLKTAAKIGIVAVVVVVAAADVVAKVVRSRLVLSQIRQSMRLFPKL
jgi:hypothetical protein